MWIVRLLIVFFSAVFCLAPGISFAEPDDDPAEEHRVSTDLPVEAIPDLTGENTRFRLLGKKPKNLLLVPIPTSNPTFGTGLILGGAYFYSQTEEQKQSQASSFTGAAAGYTSSDSWFAGVMQQNYWKEDRWRFTGLAGYFDLKLDLSSTQNQDSVTRSIEWQLNGTIFQARISKNIWRQWYLGLTARYLDISQAIGLDIEDDEFNLTSEISAAGIGLSLEFDSRDLPSNAYSGRHIELSAMSSTQSDVDADSYQTYLARFRSYHQLADPLIFAWDIKACSKSGRVPLWDTCRLGLRGFPGTEYLSNQSLHAQAEVRWRIYKRLGMVAFAGAGRVDKSFGNHGEDETIPSYGVGVRMMLLESQRINLRVDYARSDKGNEAWYLSVTEAF